ncbi:uracil permease [Biscogniauxia mediterranea]|nr:uracil permease [Biscogniauxia mediterranea]
MEILEQFIKHARTMRGEMHDRLTDPHSWKLPKQSSSIAPAHVWTNADQDPVPPARQTWTRWAFVGYWYSDLMTVTSWSASSAIVATGLTASDAVLIVLAAAVCNAVPTVLNGAVGADLHVAFPVAARASYGYRASRACVVVRAVAALFYFGVQGVNGGACVTAILTALWPGYAALPNGLPGGAAGTSQGLLSYFIYWCVQFPLLLIPTHKLQYVFWVKSVAVTPMALGMVIWITIRAGGKGDFFYAPAAVSGSARAWLWLSNLTSIAGGYSTLAVNISDFSRFSKTRGAPLWQLPCIPFFKVLIGTFGIVSASASKQLYGKTLWSPLEIIAQWQGSPGGRVAAFFCASIWLLAQISANISANSISFANDMTTLAPRWFNIRRGVVLASLVGGWALCPWIITSSASSFLNFMGGYAVFMTPIAGIFFCDYWVVKRRRYDVPALYDPNGIYRYGWGGNWRALVATLVVLISLLPGLADKVTSQSVRVGGGLKHLYSLNWLFGFIVSAFLYFGLNYLFPDKNTLIPRVISGYGVRDHATWEEGILEGTIADPGHSSVKDISVITTA